MCLPAGDGRPVRPKAAGERLRRVPYSRHAAFGRSDRDRTRAPHRTKGRHRHFQSRRIQSARRGLFGGFGAPHTGTELRPKDAFPVIQRLPHPRDYGKRERVFQRKQENRPRKRSRLLRQPTESVRQRNRGRKRHRNKGCGKELCARPSDQEKAERHAGSFRRSGIRQPPEKGHRRPDVPLRRRRRQPQHNRQVGKPRLHRTGRTEHRTLHSGKRKPAHQRKAGNVGKHKLFIRPKRFDSIGIQRKLSDRNHPIWSEHEQFIDKESEHRRKPAYRMGH